MKRKTLVAAAFAGGALLGLGSLAQAVPAVVATTPYGTVQGTVQIAPPLPRFETVPAARAGWTWAPGHYEVRDGRYEWVSGHWLQDRPGWEWQEARWHQQPDGSWILVQGHWVAEADFAFDDRRGERGPNGDMDHDGVRNADDLDRDGDGVANRWDDHPRNRNRS